MNNNSISSSRPMQQFGQFRLENYVCFPYFVRDGSGPRRSPISSGRINQTSAPLCQMYLAASRNCCLAATTTTTTTFSIRVEPKRLLQLRPAGSYSQRLRPAEKRAKTLDHLLQLRGRGAHCERMRSTSAERST